jgi:hypothetical protein
MKQHRFTVKNRSDGAPGAKAFPHWAELSNSNEKDVGNDKGFTVGYSLSLLHSHWRRFFC